jgi:uncharacterized protein YegP (UPF0339 family)
MTFKVLRTSTGDWYWDLIASNGQKLATAGESFDSRGKAERAAEYVKANASSAGLVVED